MSAQIETEEGFDCQQFHTETIVKEELILEDELPNPEPTSHENEDLSTSSFEITIKNEPLEEEEDEPGERFFATEEPDYSCNKCNKKFTARRAYNEHQLRHRNFETKRFACASCRKVFGSGRELDTHEQLHGEGIGKLQMQYKCKKCDKNFANQSSLKKHEELKLKACGLKPIVLEEEDGTFKCSTCSKTFSQQRLIDEHIRTHMRKHITRARATFQCETCELYVANKKELKQHVADKHSKVKTEPAELGESDEQGLFKCTECTKTFTQRDSMIRHLSRHEVLQKGTFQCKHCGKCFARNVELLKHSIEKHDEELKVLKRDTLEKDASGRFKCTRCEKTFDRRPPCVAHIRKHRIKESGRYQCKKCLKCFIRPNDLERHERVATTNTASLCNKHFKSLQLNKTKLLKQTDKEHHVIEEKGLFICSTCGKMFLKRRCCLAHIRRHVHMEQERFKCESCGMNFGTNKEIRRHAALKNCTSAGNERPRK